MLVAKAGDGRTRIISLSSALAVGFESSVRLFRLHFQSLIGIRRKRHEIERAHMENECSGWFACLIAVLAISSSLNHSSRLWLF